MTADSDAQRIAELQEDNKRLRRLLDQRDAPGELRHRLRSTLALFRAVIRRSASSGRDLPGYVAHLEDRLDAIARAQALADQHGEVDLHTLLADELRHYGASEGKNLLVSGPDIFLQPKAGQILALVIHELTVNAVEHGSLGAGRGRIEVRWTVTRSVGAPMVVLTWWEGGRLPDALAAHSGFGTEVLTRMLAYDLQAETEIARGLDGLQYTIRFPLPDEVGRSVAT